MPKPDPDPIDTPETALAESLAAHREALRLRRAGKPVQAKEVLRRAFARRKDACALDPSHASACWLEEESATPRGTATHKEFMSFYKEQLRD